MIPLSTISAGTTVMITRIEGGRGLVSRLRSMGMTEGDSIKVLNNLGGSLIVSRDNMRFAIGRGMSPRIFVDVAEGS